MWYSTATDQIVFNNNVQIVPSSISEIEYKQRLLEIEKDMFIQALLKSNRPEDILKAQTYISDIEKRTESEGKSYLNDPFALSHSLGFKEKPFSLSYLTLRKMSRTEIIRSIIKTRVNQVSSFAVPQEKRSDLGFIIRKKRKFFSNDIPKEPTKQELNRIQEITEFVINCGDQSNKWHGDDFDSFTKKVIRDSLEMDQMTFEIVRNRKGKPVEFFATDGGTFRLADSYDDNSYDKVLNREEIIARKPLTTKSPAIQGYYPSYVQIYDGRIVNEYYPWELCFGIRNQTTNIYSNGYGTSECEDLVNTITWLLYSNQYNGRFFSQGSNPKGILQVKGGSQTKKLQELRQQWQAQVAGVANAWKIPVIDSDQMNWVDLQKSNRDMEWSHWNEFLIKISSAIYTIDPSEIGFPMNGSNTNAMFESNNESRLKYSKDKGLRPLVRFYQNQLNKYVITPLDPDYELIFVGLDEDSEDKELEGDIKKSTTFMSLKEVRKKYNLPEKIDKDDIILNSIWMQNKQAQMMQEQQQQQMGGGNPFEQYGSEEDVEKAEESNPFIQSFQNWWDKELNN